MANLIVIESAGSKGIHIGFWEYFKPGMIVCLLSLLLSILFLWLSL
jgi:Na+/H+ antiporter NhaD/arsenite permease-like protein